MSKLALRLAAVAITLALFVWLIGSARWQAIAARLAQIDLATLMIAAGLFAASYLLRAARVFDEFRHETRGGAASIGFGSLHFFRFLRLTLIHNALVNVAPLRTGELAFPVLLKRWFGVAAERSVVALLWLRIQDAFVVLVLAALVWPEIPSPLRAAALLAIVAAAWAVPFWARKFSPRAAAGEPSARIARLRGALARSTQSHTRSWLWTIANWTVKLGAETWLLARLLGILPRPAALGALGAELASILPVQGVAGFGTFEAGAAAFMRTYNVALNDGLQAALALHLIMLACAALAGGLAAAFLPGAPAADGDKNLDRY